MSTDYVVNLEFDILTVCNLEVGNLMVGNLEFDILTIGNVEVGKMTSHQKKPRNAQNAPLMTDQMFT
jgi:hypothetical protein